MPLLLKFFKTPNKAFIATAFSSMEQGLIFNPIEPHRQEINEMKEKMHAIE